MKLKKIKKTNNKLLQLQIFKLYTKKVFSGLNTADSKQKLINLRKAADLIHKYHNTNKKILFIGFPHSFKQILKNTKHILLPEFFWYNGMLSNRISPINNSFEKKISKIMLQLKRKLDLIVVSPTLNKNSTLIKEGKLLKIAIINFRKNNNLINHKLPNNNFFFSFIKMTLNKAKKSKKVLNHRNLGQLQKLYKKMFGKSNTAKLKFPEKSRIKYY